MVLSAALGVHLTQAQTWSFRGVVAEGEQADAVRGPSNDIHVATSKYYLFDRHGNRLRAETYPGTDNRQGSMDYNPAIAADLEFEAVDEGTISQILIPEGTDNVKVGTVIAVIAGEDEDASSAKAAPAPAPGVR